MAKSRETKGVLEETWRLKLQQKVEKRCEDKNMKEQRENGDVRMGKVQNAMANFSSVPVCPRREGKIIFATRESSSSRKALYFRLSEEPLWGLFRSIRI